MTMALCNVVNAVTITVQIAVSSRSSEVPPMTRTVGREAVT